MKVTALILISSFVSAHSATHFMVIPSPEQHAEVTAAASVCPSAARMEETMGIMLACAAEDCVQMEAPELMDQVSGLAPITENGLNGIFAGLGTWDVRRELVDESQFRRELGGVDCVNDCYAKKNNAPPICCYVCSWCVGGSGGRRLSAGASSLATTLEAEFSMVRAMPKTIKCMEQRLDDQCKIELASDPNRVGCYGCSADGTFTASLSGFVTFTGAEMDSTGGVE